MREAIGWGIISQTGAHLMGCCIFGETVITHLAGDTIHMPSHTVTVWI